MVFTGFQKPLFEESNFGEAKLTSAWKESQPFIGQSSRNVPPSFTRLQVKTSKRKYIDEWASITGGSRITCTCCFNI